VTHDGSSSLSSATAVVRPLRRWVARKLRKYRERRFRRWVARAGRFVRRHAQADLCIRKDGQIVVQAANGIRLLYVPEIRRSAIDVERKGLWEPAETELILSLLTEDAVFFDVGAYVGWFTLLAARASARVEVHSFEPVPQSYELLKRNVELNGLDNVTLNNVGVWDEDKVLPFTHHRGPKNRVATNPDETRVSLVRCVRIDDYVREHGIRRIHIMKCDTDGSEMHVLRGARQTLADLRPTVLLETVAPVAAKYGHSPLDVLLFMKDLGYQYHAIDPKRGLVAPSGSPAADVHIGANFLFQAR